MKNFKKLINDNKRILITGHVSPDADCVCSGLGLSLILNRYNKDVTKSIRFILQDEPPQFLSFLNHYEFIENLDNFNSKYPFDLVIIVDSANMDRIGNMKSLIDKNSKILVIDHHISNDSYGEFNYVDFDASSTSELIYDFAKALDVKPDEDIANILYTGIVGDTGNFSYSNVSSKTLKTASKLIKYGANNENIISKFYGKKSKARLKLLGEALLNYNHDEELGLTYYHLTKEISNKYSASTEDHEGIVETLRSYEDTKVALLLRDSTDGKIKGSFRSNDFDVNRLASLFGGGGHIKAAGFKTDISVEKIIETIKTNLKNG